MRMLVRGVFNSWLTVATRLLFTSSSSRNRVMSSSSTAAPSVAPDESRMGRMRGRKEWGCSPSCSTTALSKPSGRYSCCCASASSSGCRRASGGSQTVGGMRAILAGTHAQQAAGRRIGHLHPLPRIDHQHRIGKRVDGRLAGLLRADQLGVMRLAEFAELAGHVVEGTGQLPQFIAGDDGHELVEVARPDGRRRFGHRPDGHENGADRAGQEEDGQGDAEGQAAAVPHQRGGGEAACGLVGGLHVVLVDLPDAACHLLDLQEGVVQARLAALAEIERTASGLAVGEELVARPAIGDARCGQRIDQFLLAGQGDVVLPLCRVLIEGLPLVLVLLEGLLLAAGQGELEGGVDALQGLVEIAHVRSRCRNSRGGFGRSDGRGGRSERRPSPSATSRANKAAWQPGFVGEGHGRALQMYFWSFSQPPTSNRDERPDALDNSERPRSLKKTIYRSQRHATANPRMKAVCRSSKA